MFARLFNNRMASHGATILVGVAGGTLAHEFSKLYRENNSTQPLKPMKISSEPFLYHAVGGFNISKLHQSLEEGILSSHASKREISLATNAVLGKKLDTAAELSMVIEPDNLNLTKFRISKYEISAKVPRRNIQGIVIPDNYLSADLSTLSVFNEQQFQPEYIKPNMIHLDKFFQKNFGISPLSDAEIATCYDIAMKQVGECLSDDARAKKEDARIKLNGSIMKFMQKVYKQELGKEPSVVDILQYHIEEYPIYYSKNDKLIVLRNDSVSQETVSAPLSKRPGIA